MTGEPDELTVEDLYAGSDRWIALSLYTKEELRGYDEATLRIARKNSPNFGPTGDCPCGGVLVYLCKQDVHYCAMCDTEYLNNEGLPDTTKSKHLGGEKL